MHVQRNSTAAFIFRRRLDCKPILNFNKFPECLIHLFSGIESIQQDHMGRIYIEPPIPSTIFLHKIINIIEYKPALLNELEKVIFRNPILLF